MNQRLFLVLVLQRIGSKPLKKRRKKEHEQFKDILNHTNLLILYVQLPPVLLLSLPQLGDNKSKDHNSDDDGNYAYGQWYIQMTIYCCVTKFPVVAQITVTNQMSTAPRRSYAVATVVALVDPAQVDAFGLCCTDGVFHGTRRSAREDTLDLYKVKWKAGEKVNG